MQYEYAIGPELPGLEPAVFDPMDQFWLDVPSFTELTNLINTTSLATFELAALSHQSQHAQQRQKIFEMLVPANSPAEAEQRLALNLGYVYGKLLALKSNGLASEPVATHTAEIVVEMFEDVTENLDPEDMDDNLNLFCRLRQKEIDFAGSDILGLGLSHIHGHLLEQFHKLLPEGTESDILQDHQLGTLFYAGALAGGFFHASLSQTSKDTIELSNGYHPLADGLRERRKFVPTGDIAGTVDHALARRNTLLYSNNDTDGEHVVIYPRYSQVGLQMISTPIHWEYLDEYIRAAKVPLDAVERVIIRNDYGRFEETDKEALHHFSDIVLIKTKDGFCGTFAGQHPAVEQICQTFFGQTAPSPYLDVVPNAVRVVSRNQEQIETASKALRLSRVAAGVFTAVSIGEDMLMQKMGSPNVNWAATILTSAVACLATLPVQYYRDKLKKVYRLDKPEDQLFQAYLDQIFLRP